MADTEDDSRAQASRPVVREDTSDYGKRERYARVNDEYARFWEEVKRKSNELVKSGWSNYAAMEGWQRVTSQEDWERTLAVAGSDLYRGRFLIEMLGAERYLEPERMAVLITLRRAWIEEYQVTTAPELMLVDSAIIAFHNQLRTQRIIGNLHSTIEHEFFARDNPSVKVREKYGDYAVRGYTVEDTAERLVEELQPLLDRANRMLIRNIKALRDLKSANITVNVNAPSQVNLAQQQVNVQDGPGK